MCGGGTGSRSGQWKRTDGRGSHSCQGLPVKATPPRENDHMTVLGGPNFSVLRKRCKACGILNFIPLPIEGDVHCEHCGADITLEAQ